MRREEDAAIKGGCLGGKGVRRGEGFFELAAKGSALHLGGSIAALAGYDATPLIGNCSENLRGFVPFFNWKGQGDLAPGGTKPQADMLSAKLLAGERCMELPGLKALRGAYLQ